MEWFVDSRIEKITTESQLLHNNPMSNQSDFFSYRYAILSLLQLSEFKLFEIFPFFKKKKKDNHFPSSFNLENFD